MDAFGFGQKGKKVLPTVDEAKEMLWNILNHTDYTIYTSVTSKNANSNVNGEITVMVVESGEIKSIAYWVAALLGLKCTRRLTDTVRVLPHRDIGRRTVDQMERKLNEDVVMKIKLTHKWV